MCGKKKKHFEWKIRPEKSYISTVIYHVVVIIVVRMQKEM